jgi:intein/homing endonuclease
VLGSTYERVTLPDDLVGRIEGKSSLGRLGLLIHSSLPGSEPVWVLEDGVLVPRPIEGVVRKRQPAKVAAFDPDTFAVGYHDITGWYEGPPDQIYEIGLASGRRIRLTAGHNLFTLDRQGNLTRVRTRSVRRGTLVAVPRIVPEPEASPSIGPSPAEIVVADVLPDPAPRQLTVAGPTVAAAHAAGGEELAELLRSAGHRAVTYYRRRGVLPYAIARQVPGLMAALDRSDRIGWQGGRNSIPARMPVDVERAWLLGLYVAEGYRREQQVVISNTDQRILDRASSALSALGLTFHRGPGALTCGSSILSALLGWLGAGGKAPTKRVPPMVFGWPRPLIEAFISGVVDGDGSLDGGRTSVWTTSEGLVGDLLLLFARLGRRAGSCRRPGRSNALPLWQVYAPNGEHKLLTSVPVPDQLLVRLRRESGLSQADVARRAGYAHASDLNNIERRRGREAVRRRTLRRVYEAIACAEPATPSLPQLRRLVDGDLLWDEVVEVRDTGIVEPIFDLEVRPGGRKIENFLAGSGGVFVSNTAGFIDAGFSGYLTLELSNVANLPITLYPGMKIGQVSFLRMTTPADVPYGSARVGSKYQGQRGPTPSRYWENFRDDGR